MPCVVPTCGASVGTFRLFPKHITLSERWLEAIHVGCGVKVNEDSHNLGLKEICQWHFGKPSDEVLYQEPRIFFNCKEEREMEIESCRLCLRFYPSCDMVSKNGELSGMDIKFILYESLRTDFQSNDFLELICVECLARLELLKSIQNDFMNAENKFHNLVSIIWDDSKEICRSSVEVITQKDREESNSESDGGIVEEDSSDEWTPPTAPVNILKNRTDSPVKSKTEYTSCDDSEQPEVSLKDIFSRKCYICPVVLESANDLASHLIERHANKGAYRCEECSRDFPTLPAYNKHLSRHDPTGKPYKCRFCPVCFKITRSKMIHENTYHGTKHFITSVVEKTKPTICETCGESFMYLRRLRSHILRKHASTDKPKCKICEKTFTAQSSLERHMLLHTNEKPYNCSSCDASFRRLLNLKHHVQMVHEGKNPHVCVKCNQEFNTYISLYNHKQFVHLNKPKPHLKYSYNQEQDSAAAPNREQASVPKQKRPPRTRQFNCKLCNEICLKNSVLLEHISTTHANESYPVLECPHCPRTFVSIHSLCMHKETHTDKCLCKECGKRFASFQILKKHIESIHEKRQFDCPICLTKTYKSQSALQTHMTIHTKGKQFLCEICDKSFHRKDQLTIHRRLHTGEKPFECPNCLKRFSDDGTFSKHKKRCLATIAR